MWQGHSTTRQASDCGLMVAARVWLVHSMARKPSRAHWSGSMVCAGWLFHTGFVEPGEVGCNIAAREQHLVQDRLLSGKSLV